MPALIVLNGPPAAGKSTIARRYVEDHPLALRLDVDEVRDLLGSWHRDAPAAGRRARGLATAMARDHLRAGHDVVVAQLYGRPDHLDELASVADELGAQYCEVVLMADEATTLDRFTRRGGSRLDEAVASIDGLDSIIELHRRVEELARARPHATIVTSIPADVEGTYRAVLRAVGEGA